MWFDQKHCMILSYVIPFHFILFLFHHTLLNNFPFFSFTVYVILCYAILFHFIPSLLYSIASYSTLMICCDIISYAKLRGCTPKKIGTSPRATRATTKQPQCSAVFWLGRSFFFRKAWKQTLIEATFTWFVYKMLRQSRKISNKKKDFPHCIESEFGAETFWGHHQLTNGMQSGWHSCMLTSSMLIHVLNPWICPSLAKQSDVHLTEINSASSKRSRRPKNGWTQRSQTQQPIVCVCDPLERFGFSSSQLQGPRQTSPNLSLTVELRNPAHSSGYVAVGPFFPFIPAFCICISLRCHLSIRLDIHKLWQKAKIDHYWVLQNWYRSATASSFLCMMIGFEFGTCPSPPSSGNIQDCSDHGSMHEWYKDCEAEWL